MPLFGPSLPRYQYSPLDPSQPAFRLVQLLAPAPSRIPGRRGALQGRLVAARVGDGTVYEALSYAWGDGGARSGLVVVDGGALAIHGALETALRRLAGPARPLLFVDQVCVNQDDEAEKRRQVRLMGAVYAGCARAVVWLGPASRASSSWFAAARRLAASPVLGRLLGPEAAARAMDVFDAVVDPARAVSGPGRVDRDELLALVARRDARLLLDGFGDVLDRRWFGRLWVIQEACLAPAVVFACGDDALCLDCFRAASFFHALCSTHWARRRVGSTAQGEVRRRGDLLAKKAGFARILQQRRAMRRPGARDGLYGLVLRFNVNDGDAKIGCGLAEDRVFGLLGLAAADDAVASRVRVRYGAVAAYTDVAALLLADDADALLFAQFPKRTAGLPSWVPDWAMDLAVPTGYSALRDPVFAAGGPRRGARCRLDEQTGRLTVDGVLVDAVVVVGQASHARDVGARMMEQADHRRAKLFLDETARFVGAAAGADAGADADAEARARLRLFDSGLSHRHLCRELGPEAGVVRLAALHASIDRLGQRLLAADATAASFALSRVYRTLGITPWYWTPASEVDAARLVARDPAAAALLLWTALVDFLADMAGLCLAALLVSWASHHVRLRRRFGRVQVRPAAAAVTALGLDPDVCLAPDMAVVDAHMLKNAGRRLFRTARGYVGVGPPHVGPGDCVVVLRGGSVPHLLRALDASTWAYLGEAYCDAIMDGEALADGVGVDMSFTLA